MNFACRSTVTCLLTVLLWTSQSWAQEKTLRLITCGWNAPTVGQFARDISLMPGDVPLTGCVMTLHADSGDPDPLATAHGTADWSQLDVARSIDAMASAPKTTMGDNFLLLKSNPGNVDWMDDQAWSIVVEHYRIAAALARRAGLKGLLLDFEPYTEPFRQFDYSRQPNANKRSFADYQSAARRRGQAVMNAISAEFPDAELCTYFLLSYLIEDHHERGPSPVGRSDAAWCLAGHSYGLLPAFVDGWLDVVPPTITLIDGCENGYWFTSQSDFTTCATGVRDRGVQLVSPLHRDKYRKQVRVAFPIFLDAIHPTFAGRYTLQPDRTDRLTLLRRNLRAALSAGDGLVWLYGERGRWWPPAGDQSLWRGKDAYPSWEQNLPGIREVIRSVMAESSVKRPAAEPSKTTRESSEPSGESSDQGKNVSGEIGATVLEVQPEWDSVNTQQIGTVELQSGQVTLKGVRDASGMATLTVDPNRRYMIQAHVVQQGRGMTKMAVRWKTTGGDWESTKIHDVIAYPPDGDPTEPRTVTAIVQAPVEPHQMVVVLNASRQVTDDDAALFGNLMIGVVDD